MIVDSGMCAPTVDKIKEIMNYTILRRKINLAPIDYNDNIKPYPTSPIEIMHEMFAKEVYKCMMSICKNTKN